ncbi:universal stress protein [Natronospira bacteriovora]|uniref:Universal stress protein n=1 Tax=Natronospira bacteriovora TaxID=3069753 RepID=A0ABU0W8G8_9GAMM|nr:universal stress protein [Natronospira sp. AB-CW4]MDQ2070332.1 universal stress protein [Natronospira sp. AB-CW4]
MPTFSRILAATDFSEPSLNALRRAAALLKAGQAASGCLLHVTEARLVERLRQLLAESPDVSEALRQRLDTLAADIATESGVTLSSELLSGSIPHALAEAMTADDLLVLGAQGSHRSRERLLGTTAQRLVYHSPGAALVVRKPADGPWRKVLVATDFSEASQRALERAIQLAPDAEIELLHVYASSFEPSMHYAGVDEGLIQEYRQRAGREAERNMRDFLQACGQPAVAQRLEAGYAPHRLKDRLGEQGVDLVVAGKQGQSMVRDMLVGSVTMSLLQDADCDVLVVS